MNSKEIVSCSLDQHYIARFSSAHPKIIIMSIPSYIKYFYLPVLLYLFHSYGLSWKLTNIWWESEFKIELGCFFFSTTKILFTESLFYSNSNSQWSIFFKFYRRAISTVWSSKRIRRWSWWQQDVYAKRTILSDQFSQG